jgi:hypothetical protein
MIGEAGHIGMTILDPQIEFVMKQPIEDVGAVAHADVDGFQAEWLILIGNVGTERFVCFGFKYAEPRHS